MKILGHMVRFVGSFTTLPFKLCQSEQFYGFALLGVFFAIFISFNDLVTRFHEAPFDGVFQTLFPLRRMDAGEYPGRDFFYFHGNGIPYLLYPIYWLINTIFENRNLMASLWSSFLINTICLYLPIYLFFAQSYNRKWGYASVVIFSLFNEILFIFGFYNSPLFVGAPMGIRMAPHLFALVVLNWRGDSLGKPIITIRRINFLAILVGIGPYFGAEQGVFAGVGIAVALLFSRNNWSHRITNFIYFTISSLLVFLGLQLVLFGNFETVKAIKIISDNQIWIYGVYPNTFFSALHDVFSFAKTNTIPSQIMTILATLIIAILIYIRKKTGSLSEPYYISLLAMYIGGLFSWVSNIGYVGQHQSAIFIKLVIIAACVSLISMADQRNGVS